jgi:hypothetical protein
LTVGKKGVEIRRRRKRKTLGDFWKPNKLKSRTVKPVSTGGCEREHSDQRGEACFEPAIAARLHLSHSADSAILGAEDFA